MHELRTKTVSAIFLVTLGIASPYIGQAQTRTTMPKGIMLNMDFRNATEGLVPNRSNYPLYTPLKGVQIKTLLREPMLVLPADQGLDLPHSSLIQPDGSEWIVTVRLGARPDGGNGMVVSQCDDAHGYAIYLKDGAVHAAVRTADSTLVLRQPPATVIMDCRKEMVSVELRIKADRAVLMLNRARVADAPLSAPLTGDYMPVRLGMHHETPSLLKDMPNITAQGINGAISHLLIWRK